MSSKRWRRVEEVFCSALELEPNRREEFLLEACAGDQSLRVEVEELLAAQNEAAGFMEASAVDDALSLIAVESGEPLRDHRVGPYQIIREIGRGGMGAVFLAARADDSYKKEVAIKVVKQGLDDGSITSRFRAERQILANLDHPNIAKLLDGGATKDGLPYLVMEYIEGSPIDQYCDSRVLSLAERLNLFRVSCSAVQYAHQNLVIHRDIKPSNILVTEDGTPKLVDFGIAKLLTPDGEAQAQTATAVRAMTPDYASPEQVRGDTITTATDIYSLGVLLYKLLTGCHPYRFKSLLPHDIERSICETEPARPSDAVSRSSGTSRESTEGRHRTTDTVPANPKSKAQIPKLLRGDLDNIVLMAMRKEPSRRYASVEQLSEDIRRHLSGLPVIARRDTFSYRAGKFISRHKAGVAAGVLIAMTLVASIIATVSQARVAREQRDKARSEQAKSQRINAFLQSVLQYANPSWYSAGKDKGPNTTVLDALDDAAKRVETEFPDESEVRADLHQTIGDTYRALGLLDKAEHHFRASLEIRRRLFGEDSVKVAENIFYLGSIQNMKCNYAEAEALCREALAIQRRRPDEGNNLPFMIEELASSLAARGDFVASASLEHEALEVFRSRYGDEDMRPMFAHFALWTDYYWQGDIQRALEHLEEGLKRQPRESNVDLAFLSVRLGERCAATGEYEEGESRVREGLVMFDERHARFIYFAQWAYSSLIRVLCLKGDYKAAKTEAERLVLILEQLKPRERVGVNGLNCVGLAFAKAGHHSRAESYLREALSIGTPLMFENSFSLAEAKGTLGECLVSQKRYEEAERLLIESYEGFKVNQVPRSFRIKEAITRLVKLYEAWHRPELAAHYQALVDQ